MKLQYHQHVDPYNCQEKNEEKTWNQSLISANCTFIQFSF